jgi:hypothetical protein
MEDVMDHDQNFKTLILVYPREALNFFAHEESDGIGPDVHILPVRQEQLKERLGERFRELDVPMLVEWPDGRREALLFVLEEESDPRHFSIHRLAHYWLDLAQLLKTDRFVPVVIFLHSGVYPRELRKKGVGNCWGFLLIIGNCVLTLFSASYPIKQIARFSR